MSIDVRVTAQHDYIMFEKNDQKIQIPIRLFQKFILPKLNENEYLQDSHFSNNSEGFPNYSYYGEPVVGAFRDWSKKGDNMQYGLLVKGDEIPTIMSPKVFEIFVKPTLIEKNK